jgi:recombinational DNA repair protein RecR
MARAKKQREMKPVAAASGQNTNHRAGPRPKSGQTRDLSELTIVKSATDMLAMQILRHIYNYFVLYNEILTISSNSVRQARLSGGGGS